MVSPHVPDYIAGQTLCPGPERRDRQKELRLMNPPTYSAMVNVVLLLQPGKRTFNMILHLNLIASDQYQSTTLVI